MIVDHLRARGYNSVADEFEASSKDDSPKKQTTINTDELREALGKALSGGNDADDVKDVPNLQDLLSNLGNVTVDEILSLDPTDRHEGYRELEAWVEGSLDMYRVRATHHSCLPPCLTTHLA